VQMRCATFARVLGISADEILLMRSTAEGFDVVGQGLCWKPGNRVIFRRRGVSERAISAIFARRHGIRPIGLDLRDDPDAILEDVRRLIAPRTRLVSLSHVASESLFRN
jgi:cysteine desulfurase/selenocysteine lyase